MIGYLGELTLNIPWSNLKSKPVMVHIKNVYVLAVPRNESSMTMEEMADRQYEAKKHKLAEAELVQTAAANKITEGGDNGAEATKNNTFVNQLVTKIMNNLQFSVTNIHVRYEDNVSAPGHPFATGLTLSELSAITTDENWVPQTIGDAINVIHKLATLESLSIYWNTEARSLAALEENEAKQAFQHLVRKD
jgi:vacuolar protein sorting-associated protein 13A/C